MKRRPFNSVLSAIVLRNVAILILLTSLAGTGCQRKAHFEMEAAARPISATASNTSAPRIGLWVPNTIFALTVVADESHSHLQLQFSRDGGDTFNKPIAISDPNAQVRGGGENSPVLFSNIQGDIYAAWFQSSVGATQLMASSVDFNQGPPKPVNVLDADRNSQGYAGFPTIAATHRGDVYVAWLDEREKGNPDGTSYVYFARSTDHGATFSRNLRVAGAACPCCRPQLYVASNGDIYLSWRHVFDGDVRDMVIARSADGGKTFSQAIRVGLDNWVLHACPDVGPTVAVNNNRLYVAWYSEGQGKPGIRLAVSENGGASFTPAQIVSGDVMDATHPRLSASEDGRVLLAFQGRPSNRSSEWRSNQAFLVEITENRASQPVQVTNSERSVSHPDVIAGTAGRVFLAWTASEQDRSQALLARGWLK